jgi:hypothetical protein
MALYTVICEYKEGTYIRQVRAASAPNAVERWIKLLDTAGIPGIGKKKRSALLDWFRRPEIGRAVPLSACDQVWCWSPDGVLLNIVRTFDPARGRRARDVRRELEEREDELDIAAVKRALREPTTIPLGKVKRRLGL